MIDRQTIEDTLYYGMCDATFVPLEQRDDSEWIEFTFATFRATIDKLMTVINAETTTPTRLPR